MQKLIKEEWVLSKPIGAFIKEEVDICDSRAQRLANLFDEGCEVAYVARYRQDVHNGLECDDIRKAYEIYKETRELNKKVSAAVNSVVPKIENSTELIHVQNMLKSCSDIGEVAEITKMFSSGARKTKVSIARELGYEKYAHDIIEGKHVNISKVSQAMKTTVKEVEEHITIIIADFINKMESTVNVANQISKLRESFKMTMTTSLSSKAIKTTDDKSLEEAKSRFENYIGFNKPVRYVNNNQILAIERAEELGLITVRIEIDPNEAKRVHPFKTLRIHQQMQELFTKSVNYSITKLFVPKVQKATRKHLSTTAQNAAIECFVKNIKQLFSQDGLHDRYVLAMDPGYLTCKFAFLEPSGKILSTREYKYVKNEFEPKCREYITECAKSTNGVDLAIAIGNGKGSYETQKIVSKMISSVLKLPIDVAFCVVPEDGASKYSITELAIQEMPNMKPTERSAVSIGRRLLDPMSEYVKIEPKHLGKGMYQHSLNEKKLEKALELVIKEKVSLRGVDVNCASEHLLRQVCGLNKRTAAGIIALRESAGRISSREELRKVSGLGPISFVQCSGFLKVSKPAEKSESKVEKNGNKRRKVACEWNPFDETVIHPDDYDIAEKVIRKLGLKIEDSEDLEKVRKTAQKSKNQWSHTEKKIIDLLSIEEDLIAPPKLLKNLPTIVSLQKGTIVSGVVRNQTTFGVFVDIGVEKDGLAHISKFRDRNRLPEVGTSLNFRISNVSDSKIALEPVE